VNFFGIGGLELIIIFLIAFLVLGPTRLAGFAKNLGKTMNELKNATNQLATSLEEEEEETKEAKKKPGPPSEEVPGSPPGVPYGAKEDEERK
jgi:sec-independent protein translocase protein TatA